MFASVSRKVRCLLLLAVVSAMAAQNPARADVNINVIPSEALPPGFSPTGSTSVLGSFGFNTPPYLSNSFGINDTSYGRNATAGTGFYVPSAISGIPRPVSTGPGNNTAYGASAFATGGFSTATGAGSTASGLFSSTYGAGSTASADFSSAYGAGSSASGNFSSAFGSGATATGLFSSASGAGSIASGILSSAYGNGSRAVATNSVALGAGSVATENNTVSVGNIQDRRRITNVANGVYGYDAVNMNQLKNTNGGVAVVAAMAMSIIRPRPGKTAVSLGSGYFGGQAGICATAAHSSRSGRIGFAGGVGTPFTNKGNGMVAAGGIGFEF